MIRPVLACLLLSVVPAARAAVCEVVAGVPLVFGTYASPGGAQTDSTTTLTVTCTPPLLLTCTTNYTVALSSGVSGSFTPRQLASGANRLNYNLYTGATRTTIWGDGTGGSSLVNGSISGGILGLICYTNSKIHTVYGRIPASQNVGAGLYADTITVTVSF